MVEAVACEPEVKPHSLRSESRHDILIFCRIFENISAQISHFKRQKMTERALFSVHTTARQAGTAISALMVGGINSDLPGMVIGQVAENVYDTATGRFLLLPQGSRLIGSYDNMVSNGQTRVGVIWNRVIFPDTESIDLGSMEGADQGGYAGFHDQVNTHFWSKIGNALLISIAGAGVQLSQPQAPVNENYSSQQIAAASLGQQFGQLGQEYARAGLSIPNTLEIRPGYRLVVMVNKDMHLRPYVDHRTAGGSIPIRLGPVVQ